MKILHVIYLFGIVGILPTSIYAAGSTESWAMTHFNSENGLPQNSVTYAEMDNDGYLWLTTQAGIVRYDGQRFRLFDNTNSALLRNRFMMLGKDSNDRIYCIDDYLNTAFYNSRTGFSRPAFIPSLVTASDGGLIDFSRLDMEKLVSHTKRFSHGSPANVINFQYHAANKARGFIVWNNAISGYVSNGKVRRIDSLDCKIYVQRSIGCVGDKLCYISQKGDIVLMDSNGVRTRQKIPVAVSWDKLRVSYSVVAFFGQGQQLLLNLDGDIYEIRLNGDELKFHHLIRVKDIPLITCIRYYPVLNPYKLDRFF